MSRPTLLVLVTFLAAAIGLALPDLSSATYMTSSQNSATVSAAPDWTPPTALLENPGSPLKDTVTLTAGASDGESGVQDVKIQYLPANGSAWVTVCTDTSAPYSCSWATRSVTDGTYDLRAVATDRAGYSTTSDTVRTTVANSLLVVLTSPGDVVRGTVPLATTLYNTGTVTYSVRVEYAPAGTNSWKNICTNLPSPYTCSWATAGINDYVDLRAAAVSGGTTTYSSVVPDVLVDNLAPTVSLTDPGTPLSGTRTLAASAADAGSGVAQVVIQYAPSGTTAFKTLCTLATSPYSCRLDTTTLADGSYDFRATATDLAGNGATSQVVVNRVVDNTVSSVSMDDPGAFLAGTAALSATANSSAGVTSVRIQRAANGTASWTDVCADSTAPYTCAWDTTKVVDGLYDLRAVLLDGAGRTTTSATIAARRVDNTPLRAADVQTANGGVATGKLDAGDTLTFTYTDQVDLTTVSPGWSGADLTVTLRLRDGNLLSLGNRGDTVDVTRSGSSVNLGSVNLGEDYIKSSKTSLFNATMTAGTKALNGVTVTTVTIRLVSLASGGALRTATAGATMVWTPLPSVVDLSRNACSAAPATESGSMDREF